MYRQGWNSGPCSDWDDPMPYRIRLEMMPKPALALWKTSDREACSRVVYLPLERAQGDQVGEVLREPDAEDHDAPHDHVARQHAAHPVALQDEVGRELEEDVREVEDGRQPRVLLSDEPRVLLACRITVMSVERPMLS
ncbi:hypothetical protein ANO14919_022800 [Xylariales sp. No.14919]|nr:hypothetical protein ANO14919_022800 [Xylariales sp. No.14919]